MELKIGSENYQRAASSYIRMRVFVLEQEIPMEDEFDDNDGENTVYVVIYDGNKPVATGRYLLIDDGTTLRPTRIATLPEYRGQQLGTQIINALEDYAKTQGIKKSVIHADLRAVPFYQKLGYEIFSEVYQEDGVDCQNLKRDL